jgi:hypothetical protein
MKFPVCQDSNLLMSERQGVENDKRQTMKAILMVMALLGGFASATQAAEELPQPCIQIRERIKAVTGLVAVPSIDLIQQIGKHPECSFTSAEIYRSARGDKPAPPQESHDQRRSQEHDDD